MEIYHILVVEDDPDINKLLCRVLSGAGYDCRPAYSGSEAALWAGQYDYDLVLLDLMLPGLTGEEFITQLRQRKTMPIIVLSAKAGLEDRVNVLKLGADDFIPKPFDNAEVLARVEAQLRRYTSYGTRAQDEDTAELSVDGLVINRDARTVTVDEKPVRCTPLEYSILLYLVEHRGKVVSVEDLFRSVWGEEFMASSSNTVMVHIRHLREKIGDDASNPRFIKNIWGVGYTIEG